MYLTSNYENGLVSFIMTFFLEFKRRQTDLFSHHDFFVSSKNRFPLKLFVFLLSTIAINEIVVAQQNNVQFVFGHSLINHESNTTPSQETSVPHWLVQLSEAGGHSYSVDGNYGFLPQHQNVPPIANWGFDSVSGVWDSDNEPFSDADFNNILITPGNFIQGMSPGQNYYGETFSPLDATNTVFDWCKLQETGMRYFVYENWPDMAPYLSSGFPPNQTEWESYNTYLQGGFHDWFIEYHDSLAMSQADICVKMIPAGPVISGLLQTAPYDQIDINDLYEDDAPHGRPTVYFLAALTTYMAIYEEKAPSDFVPNNFIDSIIRDNYNDVVDIIWNELLQFDFQDGTSRVFCGGDPITEVVVGDKIQYLNDEFNDSRSLVNWKNINIEEEWGIEQLEHYSINDTTAGKLVMIPRTASWFGGWRGPLLYKEVSGDFTVTTKVDIMGRDNPELPELDYNLAGIMIRHVREYPDGALDPTTGWTANDNNYIFLASGAAADNHPSCNVNCPGPHFEVKNTINGSSTLRVVPIDTSSTMIRITRIGDVFIVMYRLESDHVWVVHQRYHRSDFPDTLQVGLVVYTDWTNVSAHTPQVHNTTELNFDPDIIGEFEYFRMDSVVVPMGIGSNFMDEVDVTDAELLGFLDYASTPFCPEHIEYSSPIDSSQYLGLNASSSISFSDSIASDAITRFSASDSVLIKSGFQAVQGSIVEIDNEGCN